jgi:RIO kinase 2
MKLDVTIIKHLSRDDFRVLNAVELGSRNHEVVPTPLLGSLSGLSTSHLSKCLSNLLRFKLLQHDRSMYDGYVLTYPGYDMLALRSMFSRKVLSGVGRTIGVGKESDVFQACTPEGETVILKLQRLGRTSFRDIKKKRDYVGNRRSVNWCYLSRLGAAKEFAFMSALHDAGFPTPTPLSWNRHAVVMSVAAGVNLSHVRSLGIPTSVLFDNLMGLISRLAAAGLVHCDFNEFNLMVVPETGAVTIIDFPQMVSTSHPNAGELFDRDVKCLRVFFARRFGYTEGSYPTFESVAVFSDGKVSEGGEKPLALDLAVEASGVFTAKQERDLEHMLREQQREADGIPEEEEEEGEDGGGEERGEEGTPVDASTATDPSIASLTTDMKTFTILPSVDDLGEEVGEDVSRRGEEDTCIVTAYDEKAATTAGAAPRDEDEEEEEEDEEDDEDEDEESSGEESGEEESADLVSLRRLQRSEAESRLFDRPPDGARNRASGGRVRAANARGGEAYLRKKKEAAEAAAAADIIPGAGVTRSEVADKVKKGLDKAARRTALASASAVTRGNRNKNKDKAKAREEMHSAAAAW